MMTVTNQDLQCSITTRIGDPESITLDFFEATAASSTASFSDATSATFLFGAILCK